MDAATLTTLRAEQGTRVDGDHGFVVSCKLGKYGTIAQHAHGVARLEANQDSAPHTHHTDTRIADRIVELVNATAPGENPPPDEFADLVHRLVADSYDGDYDYSAWLYAAGAACRALCGYPPNPADLAEPSWRQQYERDVNPDAAARAALHERPMVQIDAGRLMCPVCRTAGGPIVAEQQAVRRSHVCLDGQGIYAQRFGSKPEFVHTSTRCGECHTPLRLPVVIDEEHWL